MGKSNSAVVLDTLVERVRQEGVETGKKQATEIIAGAEEKARKILAKAEAEAGLKISAAQKEAVQIEERAKSTAKQVGISLEASIKRAVNEILSTSLGQIAKAQLTDQGVVRELILSLVRKFDVDTMEMTVDDSIDIKALTNEVCANLTGKTIIMKPGKNFPGISVKFEGQSAQYEITSDLIRQMIFAIISESNQALLFPGKK